MSDSFAGSSSRLTSLPLAGGDCWNRIGTSGDRSCPELNTHIHCRNCPVFASAARAFFDRPAPEGYLAEWTQWLASSEELARHEAGETLAESDRDRVGVLIFRLGREWLAFRTQTVAEVTVPRPVHRIPHRSNATLIGLVNLRGQLQLCVSLHGLLGVEATPGPPPPSQMHLQSHGHDSLAESEKGTGTGFVSTPGSRLVVLRDRERSESWVFAAEEVLGVHRLPRSLMRSVSSTLANPEVSFSQAILSWEGRSISFLDEQRVFAALRSNER
jgi:chemotaxis-related protein WspD